MNNPISDNPCHEFHVPEMDCAEEFLAIRRRLETIPGVLSIHADYLQRTLRVCLDSRLTNRDVLSAAVIALGFRCQPIGTPFASPRDHHLEVRDVAVIAGSVLLVTAFMSWTFQWGPRFTALTASAAAIVAGMPVGLRAVRALRGKRIDMNVLMMIAAVGAIAIGDHFEAATAMVLFGVANWLETRSFRQAGQAVASLLEMLPDVAHRYQLDQSSEAGDLQESDLTSEKWEDISANQIRPGDVLRIRPGERIPTDGRVLFGDSTVSEAHITGESIPIDKQPASTVFGGSQNGDATLTIVAESTADQSTMARVASLVAEARARTSDSERLVDRFAAWYTPAVIAMAVVIGLGVPVGILVSGQSGVQADWIQWFHRGLVLLVIACPCALVISTPITMVCGLHRATKLGVVVKSAAQLERLATIQGIAFDKTGTLTEGKLHVVAVDSSGLHTEDDVLACAAALEVHSEHPLAVAVVRAAEAKSLKIKPATSVTMHRGAGVQGMWSGQRVLVGTRRFFEVSGIRGTAPDDHLPEDDQYAELPTIYVARDGALMGKIRLADTVRHDAADAVEMLHRMGLSSVMMLTGDRRDVASAVARQVGIREVFSELLPEDKIAKIDAARNDGPVAMVGDGVNDAPALVHADVGIGMGRGASDLAIEAADVVVLSTHLVNIAQTILLARSTRRVLWQNIGLALGIKLLVLAITLLGHGSMWLAVAADVGASLLVVANGMRLLHWQPPIDFRLRPQEINAAMDRQMPVPAAQG